MCLTLGCRGSLFTFPSNHLEGEVPRCVVAGPVSPPAVVCLCSCHHGPLKACKLGAKHTLGTYLEMGTVGSPLPEPLFQGREINSVGLKTLCSPRGHIMMTSTIY